MSFPEKATTRDLSEIAENQDFPAYDSSMAGSNMVTEKNPHFAGQGSDSEATHDVVAASANWAGNMHNTPVLPGSDTPASDLDTDEPGSSYAPHPREWKEI